MPPSSSRSLSRAPLRFRVARAILRLVLGAVFRVRIEGLDRLPPGPYVLASNHLSWVDPFLLLGWLPASPRVHFLGRRSAIYNRRWKRWVLGYMGGIIPVDSGEIRHLSVAVRGVLEHGGVAAIFPEGAVGTAEGVLQPLRRGVAHFAGESSVPVVTVGIAGTRELWRGKPIALRIGTTVEPTGSLDLDMAAIEVALRAALPPYRDAEGARRPWPWLTTLLR
ncbi:MAG TPA: lysophospholipid acyltransferase family protein [Terriglobales bacterium]|nr:lysophospholipid acyltransferase family protein [Terriglobales bacterium]